MISESWYWKQPLLETAERLRALKNAPGLTDEQFVQLEKDIFLGFYSVRKLLEAPTKLTDATRGKKLPVTWHPNNGTRVTWRNNHKLDELYDFSRENGEVRDVWFISSRIIHSFIFAPLLGEGGIGVEAVLFTSDTDKDSRLYSLHINRVIELFELVGNDDPTQIHWQRNPDTGEETTVVK